MEKEFLRAIFEQWVENGDYHTQSVLENGKYHEYTEKMRGIVGKEEYDRISDEVGGLVCESETAGFNNGFRYGVMFMAGMLKGGAVYV